MKTIVFSHYTIKDIDPEPWRKTWENLVEFGEHFAPKLEPMDIKLKLRKVIMDDITEDNLMMGNMVTVKSEELDVEEAPIENMLMLELDFSECPSCVTPDGVGFACRTFKDFAGKECQVLPREFFIETALRIAFKAHVSGCDCGDCASCASGCGDEPEGNCDCSGHHHH